MNRVKLVGQTKLRNQDGDALANHVSIEVDGDAARLSADSPQISRRRRPIESQSPDVARFLRRWVDDIHETAVFVANRSRPPLADPKPKDLQPIVDLPDHLVVACPACNGEGHYLCNLCDGDGCVTRRLAAAWRNAH